MEEAEPLPKLPSHNHVHSLSYHSPDKGFSQSNVYSSVMALSYFRINERPFTSLEKKLMHEKYKVNILEKTNILKKGGVQAYATQTGPTWWDSSWLEVEKMKAKVITDRFLAHVVKFSVSA